MQEDTGMATFWRHTFDVRFRRIKFSLTLFEELDRTNPKSVN